jgi:hypothetical protein
MRDHPSSEGMVLALCGVNVLLGWHPARIRVLVLDLTPQGRAEWYPSLAYSRSGPAALTA